MADIFDVVADPTRRDLLARLLKLADSEGSGGEISVGQLVSELGVSQPTVSKHLKTLRDHGLVTVREEGQHRYYRLDPTPLAELRVWLSPFVDDEPQSHRSTDPGSTALLTSAEPWAGSEVGDRIGRVAADTAHTARTAVREASGRLDQGRELIVDRLPRRSKRD